MGQIALIEQASKLQTKHSTSFTMGATRQRIDIIYINTYIIEYIKTSKTSKKIRTIFGRRGDRTRSR